MKRFTLLTVLMFFITQSHHGQTQDHTITSKDSIVQSSWIFGLGYNFVDDSGDVFDDLFAFDSQWNALSYPNRISAGRYFKSGLGIEAIGTYNKYKAGKIIDKAINDSDKTYLGFDARLTYDLNKLIGETAWFDPYVGVGIGYTDANNVSRGTYNAVIGFRTWFNDRIGLDLNSSGKWSMTNAASNHIQHAAGVVYRFGIEKGLSKKGKEKLAMSVALEKEKQRVNDSINALKEARAAEALAKRLAKEKEKARLARLEKEKLNEENRRKQALRDKIEALGFVYFDLNSSYINETSKTVLDSMVVILGENTDLQLRVGSHTDSRGKSKYNLWLSERRVKRTVDYLVQKGINTARLTTRAYGEDKLLNDCDDTKYCTEDEHQVNRRSEFTIIDF